MQDKEAQAQPVVSTKEAEAARSSAGFLAGMIFGAFLGAGIALILATEGGGKSRKRLSRRMRMLREGAMDTLDDAGIRTRKELQRRKKRLRAELERIRQRARERAREARAAQE